ncbi:MAG TPA: EthD domain-containing protein, partial [Acidimicrobiales bacterium]|nr:EthD domain-containing protein [Acidimicrobiales bacterium]
MTIETMPERGTSRRTFLAGATAAGISAIAAAYVPRAAATTTPMRFPEPLTGVKLTCVCRRRSDLTLAEFNDYWLHKHAPLATQCVKTLGAYRYVQSHLADDALTTLVRTS